jgi:AhpC/TSA family
MGGFWIVAFLVQWFLLIMLSILIFGILRYLRSIQSQLQTTSQRVTRFSQGDKISNLTLVDLDGSSVSISQLFNHGRKVLLLLLTTTCSTCETIVLQLNELVKREGGIPATGWSVALISHGQQQEVERLTRGLEEKEGITLLVDSEAIAARQYFPASLPVGIALDERGYVLDQSPNPGPNWLYLTLNVPAPDRSVLPERHVATITYPGT